MRERYAAAARGRRAAASAGCCGPTASTAATSERRGLRRRALRRQRRATALPRPRVSASLGCGVPTAVADLHEGETVLDLGSGAGADVLISARRVGPTGRAIGLDMTDEMLELARANAARGGRRRTSSSSRATSRTSRSPDDSRRRGHLQLRDQPLRATSRRCSREAARVLRPGGRFAVSDVIADPDMDEATRADMAAVDRLHRRRADPRASSSARSPTPASIDVEIRETHRVHEHAASAIVRARKPRRERRPRSSSTTRRRSTGAGRTRSGPVRRSTSPPTASSGRRWTATRARARLLRARPR